MKLTSDLIWTLVSFVLTLMVFSYLLGDNPFFRFVSALFVGVTAGYFFVILFYQVILVRLVTPLVSGSMIVLIPLLLSGMLLLKLSPKLSKYGNIPMAMLVGIGAAVTIGGAVLGTLIGQIKGALNPLAAIGETGGFSSAQLLLQISFMLMGTIATLIYFNFSARKTVDQPSKRGKLTTIFAWVGQFFIALTLGAVFAGVLTAAVTALIERSDFIIQTINRLIR